MRSIFLMLAVPLTFSIGVVVKAKEPFSAMDVFKIAYAANSVVSPNGQVIAFDRFYMDVMTDTRRSDLWLIGADGRKLRQISNGFDAVGPAAFTASGDAIAFAAAKGEKSHIYLQQLETGERKELGQNLSGPANLSFSPDGQWLAFTMPVAYEPEKMGDIPSPPKGAKWADAIVVETRSQFRQDGVGYLPFSRHQVFLIPTEGGAARQLTQGQQDHNSALEWVPDSSGLLMSINIKNNVNKPWDTDIVRLDIKTSALTALTTQSGPDLAPQVSPDGKRVAWLGHQDRPSIYHEHQLYTAKLDGSDIRELTSGNDLSVIDFAWHPDNQRHYIQYDERGKNVLSLLSDDGSVSLVTDKLGGWELDQPYVQGQFSASSGVVAFTQGNSTTPTELAVVDLHGKVKTLTDLNKALHKYVRFTIADEHSVKSSFDQREIQYWIMRPPNFDPTKSYPMLLQIHGGPWAAYGPQFAANNQLYAAAGYVVVYGNPRGSTGYGSEYAHTIDHNFPSRDYDDLMDIVDATLAMGFVDEEQLYVFGGSGGGTLTAWVVGKTDRFRAAVAVNAVINWGSLVLTTDLDKLMASYWFTDRPWVKPMDYWSHSPLSLVGNVTTPTMLMTGEEDWRTPIWEAEQYFNALQIEGVETALVRVPGASHQIEYRPSQLIAKVNAILAWFDRHSKPVAGSADE
ncbi:S9 family peptidase [Gammaproteobacteria bacterium]|nr:S9 family peptidase [Gammaproteobacteria bacterium]